MAVNRELARVGDCLRGERCVSGHCRAIDECVSVYSGCWGGVCSDLVMWQRGQGGHRDIMRNAEEREERKKSDLVWCFESEEEREVRKR